jgi:hypothetical protein
MVQRKTAAGKMLDMNALIAKNERTRAVGNMNVNARGDIIDSHNRVINDATRRVSSMYNKTMQSGKKINRVSHPTSTVEQAPNQVVAQSELDKEFTSYDDDWDPKLKK